MLHLQTSQLNEVLPMNYINKNNNNNNNIKNKNNNNN